MIKKTFYIFSIILLLGFFVLPKLSLAEEPLLTASNVKSTSATLKATYLGAGQITIGVGTSNASFPYYKEKSCTLFQGDCSVSFTGLSPNVLYNSLILGPGITTSFTTPASPGGGKSSEKSITNFTFTSMSPTVVGVINGTSISLTVPTGTNITAIVPTITTSNNATVSPLSGVAKDFTNGVNYTVTAQDGSKQTYVAAVFVLNNILTVTTKDITDTSVTFMLTGFPHNKEISFDVTNDSGTPNYTDYQTYTTDDSGAGSIQFAGLNPGGKYKYTHSESNNIGSFSTTGSGGGGGGNNNNKSTGKNSGLVPCNTSKNPAECGFNDLFKLINTVINFILIKMAVPIAAIMFAYAGFMLVSSAGSPEKRTEAKKIFINVAIGLVVVAGAWIFVHTILVIVGYKPGLLNWFGL
ncbi:MAG: DUF5018 domain-containing protein [bacterium]